MTEKKNPFPSDFAKALSLDQLDAVAGGLSAAESSCPDPTPVSSELSSLLTENALLTVAKATVGQSLGVKI